MLHTISQERKDFEYITSAVWCYVRFRSEGAFVLALSVNCKDRVLLQYISDTSYFPYGTRLYLPLYQRFQQKLLLNYIEMKEICKDYGLAKPSKRHLLIWNAEVLKHWIPRLTIYEENWYKNQKCIWYQGRFVDNDILKNPIDWAIRNYRLIKE